MEAASIDSERLRRVADNGEPHKVSWLKAEQGDVPLEYLAYSM